MAWFSTAQLIFAACTKFQLLDCIYGTTSTMELGAWMSWLLCLDIEKRSSASFSHELICCWWLGKFFKASFYPCCISLNLVCFYYHPKHQLLHPITKLSTHFFLAFPIYKPYYLDVKYSCSTWKHVEHSTHSCFILFLFIFHIIYYISDCKIIPFLFDCCRHVKYQVHCYT